MAGNCMICFSHALAIHIVHIFPGNFGASISNLDATSPTISETNVNSMMRHTTDEDDIDVIPILDDVSDVEDDDDDEDELHLHGLSDTSSTLFGPPQSFSHGKGARVFQAVLVKAVGGFRPSILLHGTITEHSTGSVIERNLELSLRYEPPSPKFTRQHPGEASYRLKLQHQKSSHLSFSTRGLPQQLQLYCINSGTNKSPLIVITWGFLNLSFEDDAQRVAFLSALRSLQLVSFAWDHSHLAWIPGSVEHLTGSSSLEGVSSLDPLAQYVRKPEPSTLSGFIKFATKPSGIMLLLAVSLVGVSAWRYMHRHG